MKGAGIIPDEHFAVTQYGSKLINREIGKTEGSRIVFKSGHWKSDILTSKPNHRSLQFFSNPLRQLKKMIHRPALSFIKRSRVDADVPLCQNRMLAPTNLPPRPGGGRDRQKRWDHGFGSQIRPKLKEVESFINKMPLIARGGSVRVEILLPAVSCKADAPLGTTLSTEQRRLHYRISLRINNEFWSGFGQQFGSLLEVLRHSNNPIHIFLIAKQTLPRLLNGINDLRLWNQGFERLNKRKCQDSVSQTVESKHKNPLTSLQIGSSNRGSYAREEQHFAQTQELLLEDLLGLVPG
jgi:hypothetical protein